MRNEYDFSKARRGAILPVTTGKTRITIRIDDDILEWLRQQVHQAGGGNYQTLLNQALRRVKEAAAAEPLEVVVRRAIRAELRRKPRRPTRARSGRAA
jgi:predicted DNA binding CopG/RHH family protein